MALGMRSWLGAVAAGVALMAVWKLPPSSIGTVQADRPAEEGAYLDLSGELNAAYAALQRLRWSDSLGAAVVRASSAQHPVVLAPEGSDEERLATIRDRLAAAAPPTAAADRFVLARVFQPLGHGLDPEVRTDARARTETYVGSSGGVDYCMRVVVADQLGRAIDELARRLASGTGWRSDWAVCGIFAEHGWAGEDVTRWLEGGAASFALIDVPLAMRGMVTQQPRRRLFGRSWAALGADPPTALQGCITGDEGICASTFLNPLTVASGSEAAARAAARSPALSVADALPQYGAAPFPFLLADLEADFGSEAFGRFWRSDAPVEVAFQEAFGVTPGTWVLSWVERIYGIDSAGPRLVGSSTTWPLGLTFALFAAVAIAFNRRRRVA